MFSCVWFCVCVFITLEPIRRSRPPRSQTVDSCHLFCDKFSLWYFERVRRGRCGFHGRSGGVMPFSHNRYRLQSEFSVVNTKYSCHSCVLSPCRNPTHFDSTRECLCLSTEFCVKIISQVFGVESAGGVCCEVLTIVFVRDFGYSSASIYVPLTMLLVWMRVYFRFAFAIANSVFKQPTAAEMESITRALLHDERPATAARICAAMTARVHWPCTDIQCEYLQFCRLALDRKNIQFWVGASCRRGGGC